MGCFGSSCKREPLESLDFELTFTNTVEIAELVLLNEQLMNEKQKSSSKVCRSVGCSPFSQL